MTKLEHNTDKYSKKCSKNSVTESSQTHNSLQVIMLRTSPKQTIMWTISTQQGPAKMSWQGCSSKSNLRICPSQQRINHLRKLKKSSLSLSLAQTSMTQQEERTNPARARCLTLNRQQLSQSSKTTGLSSICSTSHLLSLVKHSIIKIEMKLLEQKRQEWMQKSLQVQVNNNKIFNFRTEEVHSSATRKYMCFLTANI